MSNAQTPLIWSIAGSDSSGASGIQADVTTAAAFGVHGCTVVTATTAQSNTSFRASYVAAAEHVLTQIDALKTMPAAAIKMGMLGDAEVGLAVAKYLKRSDAFVVLDTPLTSSSGGRLADDQLEALYRESLIPRADLVTPNIPEVERLLGSRLDTDLRIVEAAEGLLKLGARSVLIKGGHSSQASRGGVSADFYQDKEKSYWLTGVRHPHKCRATGCILSTAIAANLARGLNVDDAITIARAYVSRGIRTARALGRDEEPSPLVFNHAPWPVEAVDLPWISAKKPSEHGRLIFPAMGKRPIGFYPIVDRAAWLDRLAPLGVDIVQLRAKDLDGARLESEVAKACATARRYNMRLFINDSWSLAIKYGAYGTHLGQEDLLAADLAEIAQSGLRLGLSTHSYEEAARAAAVHASYVALGPIFHTTAKAMRFQPQGFAMLKEWRSLFDCPLVAIGGIRLSDAPSLKACGADGIAVISDLRDAADPERQAKAWLEALKRT